MMRKLYEWLDSIWGWLSRIVFVRFEFDIPVESLQACHREGRLIFTIVYGGFIEWLILSSWCRTKGLGAILVVNRKRVLWLAKPLYFLQILFRARSYADLFLSDEPGPRLLFCPPTERKKLYVPTATELTLSELYSRLGQDGKGLTFHVVPVTIRWRKYARGAKRTLSEVLLGLSSNPNWLGKFWYLLRRRMDSTVKSLDSFTLQSFGSSAEGVDALGETESLRIAKNIRRKILVSTFQEIRVVLGPKYESPIAVKESLMRDPEILALIDEIAKTEGVDKRKIMMQAYQYFTEIAANYRFRFIEFMYVFLTWLFNRVFDGLDSKHEELLTVRETLKGKPVIFVSSHRSHLDYLVVPYVLFLEDMVPPFIVAGINLAFWPVGPFLRMGGAFFIRRSFRGNPLYSLCLRKYVEYLIKNRFTIKFFIEGTRSRSGKMLPPAFGLLKMILDTYNRKVVDDIALIPVSLCYDEVLEERSYTKELAGAKKETESAGTLIKSRSNIKRNIGKVYVRFAKPLFVKELVQTSETSGLDPKLTLQKTAFQLCKTINDVTPITPKAIVSSILLTHHNGSLSLEDILRLSDWMASYTTLTHSELSTGNGESFRRAIEQNLRRLQKTGAIEVLSGVPRRYQAISNRRSSLNFYKNSSMHCFVTPSIALLSLFSALRNPALQPGESVYDKIIQEAAGLRNLLKFEFFFSPTPVFVNEIRLALTYFCGDYSMESEMSADDWQKQLRQKLVSWRDSSIYLNLIGDLLESYLVAAQHLKENVGSRLEKKLLIAQILKYGESLNNDGNIFFAESVSLQNYSNALLLFENMGFIGQEASGDKSLLVVGKWNDQMSHVTQRITRFLEVMSAPPSEPLLGKP